MILPPTINNSERAVVWNKAHPERRKEISKKFYKKNKMKVGESQRLYYDNIKWHTLVHYSGESYPSCSVCGEQRTACLSIDHIHNNGAEERKRLGCNGGVHFYKWLKDNNYPEGYQVLCMNCQFIKRDEVSKQRRKSD